ncbi:MAG: hypothetical protein JWO89_1069 [Verrucomicrobiaceae bacterium]|nr:hypothetical protein [Verrucomicrobiaceae bacterium]
MWYHAKNEHQHGPYSEADIKSLLADEVITPQTLVWRNGMSEWLPLEQTELAKTFEAPLAKDDSWETCAYSGDRVRRSDMFQVEGKWVSDDYRAEAEAYVQKGGHLPRPMGGLRPEVNLGLGYLLHRARNLLLPCLVPASLLFLMVAVPMQFLFTYLQPLVTDNETETGLLSIGLGVVFNPFATGGILLLLSQNAKGLRPGFTLGFNAGLAFWGRLMFMQIFIAVTTLMGCFILILPGIIIATRTALASAAAVERRLMPAEAIKQSWLVTEGQTLRTIGCFMIVGVACALPDLLLSSILRLVAPAIADSQVGLVLGALFSLPVIFFMAFQFCYYKELDTLYQASQLQQTAAPDADLR